MPSLTSVYESAAAEDTAHFSIMSARSLLRAFIYVFESCVAITRRTTNMIVKQ